MEREEGRGCRVQPRRQDVQAGQQEERRTPSPFLAAAWSDGTRTSWGSPLCLAGPETVQYQPLRGGVLPHPGVLRQDAVFPNPLQRLPPGLPAVAARHATVLRGWVGLSPRPPKSYDSGKGGHELPKVQTHTHAGHASSLAVSPGLAQPVAPASMASLQTASGMPC